jgi:hypothetical protein
MRNGLVYSCTLNELRFLSAHEYLFAILAEAKPHLTRIFGSRRICLQVEQVNGSEELFAVVKVNGKLKKARFNREWLTSKRALTP